MLFLSLLPSTILNTHSLLELPNQARPSFRMHLSLLSLVASVACVLAFNNATARPHDRVLQRRATLPLGLSSANLRHGRLAVGFFPAYSEPITPSTATALNKLLRKPMSIVGTFCHVNGPKIDTTFRELDGQIAEIAKMKGTKPVYSIAMMPNAGLKAITPTVAKAIAAKCAEINAKVRVTVSSTADGVYSDLI